MTKRGISKKRGTSKKITTYNPDDNLKQIKPKEVLKALMYCIEYSDYEAFRYVVDAYVKIHNKVAIAKDMGVSRRALYHMISEDGNPTVQNIMSFYQAIKKAA